jgi:hypothetical protein
MSDVHPIETFLPIEGFPGYRVSGLGTVQSCWSRGAYPRLTDKWRDLRTTLVQGYPSLTLSREGQESFHRVHLLVIRAFRGPAPEGMECRHIDGNRGNPRLDNLEYGTRLENMADRDSHGTTCRGERHPKTKLRAGQVVEMRRRASEGEAVAALAREFGIRKFAAQNIVARKTWKHIP